MVHVVLVLIYIMFLQAQATPTVDLVLPLPPPESLSHLYTYYPSPVALNGPVQTLAGMFYCPIMHLSLLFTTLPKH